MALKILFLIHDLGNGGAEKVLINLVNHMDRAKFDITVMTVFGGAEQRRRLSPHIRYCNIFKRAVPGNSKIMKLFEPRLLHNMLIHDHYDVEIAYLEGPDSRIISGCRAKDTFIVNWVHGEIGTISKASLSFRSTCEAQSCYNRFNRTICVSKTVKNDFTNLFNLNHQCDVIYNTVESDIIKSLSSEEISIRLNQDCINIISVGTLKNVKGFDRLVRVVKRIKDITTVHLYIIGDGPIKHDLKYIIHENMLTDNITLLGFQSNPYKYVAKCDLFVCSSYREGFSTAVTEALIVGTPVVSTCCSGAYELLGDNNEYGIVVDNSEEGLYKGIKQMVTDHVLREDYKKKAAERGKQFSTEKTVKAVEEMLLSL